MSRPQWFALAALALVCLAGGANSPQSEDFLHPWRLVAGLHEFRSAVSTGDRT